MTDKQLKRWSVHNSDGTMPPAVAMLASELLTLRAEVRRLNKQTQRKSDPSLLQVVEDAECTNL